MNKKALISLISILFVLTGCGAEPQPTDIAEAVRALPGVGVEEVKAEAPFERVFEITFTQPLDHDEPGGEMFEQRLILSHVDVAAPVVLVTEGYAIGHNFIRELSEILGANQLRVEHRFMGQSAPKEMKWSYLNLKQATADYHRIVTLFKSIYKGSWVSTGWSKGGQTALAYRRYYPDDVAAVVAYDAPLNFSVQEPRIDAFFDTVGTAECRERLVAFQRSALKNKKELLPLFRKYAGEKKYTYSIGEEKAFEYCVLEYTFSFWQYHHIDCETVPGEGASVEEIFEHLRTVVSLSSYSDAAMDSPAMHQFCTEFGYYGYVQKNVKEFLSSHDYDNCEFAPRGVEREFRPQVMWELSQWLKAEGNRILYIYGDRDPWSASAVEIGDKTDALKVFLEGGNHFTFINTFPEEQRTEIITRLKGWLTP